MIIFGTAGKRKVLELDPGHTLFFVYRYFHIFWLLRLAYGGRYEMATMTDYGWANRPVSKIEAEQMSAGRCPKISPWDQWSLIGAIVVILACSLISGLTH